MTKVKRKYDDDYLNYGFIFVDKGNEQCVVCLKTFSNASMKPYQLKQHQVKVHPQLAEKNRSYFELKANQVKKMRLDTTSQFQTTSKAILTASYAVSLQVAKAKEPHNIAETLIKPCLVECANILLDSNAVSKIKQVSLSNDTVKSRIDDMACNIKSKLVANLKASPVFAIQLDESVDVANLSQLMVSGMFIIKPLRRTFFFVSHWKLPQRPAMCSNCWKNFLRLKNWIGINSVVCLLMGHLLCWVRGLVLLNL